MNVDERREQLVIPFYGKMMRRNVLWRVNPTLESFVAAADIATPDDVVGLLESEWRESTVGAWMALRHDTPEVREALLQALASSLGTLNAPALATAAVLLSGHDALPALLTYVQRFVENAFGWCATVVAAIEYLGGDSPVDWATPEDHDAFTQLLVFGQRIRAGS